MRVAYCQGCFEKQIEIDRLKEENRQLKAALRYERRKATEGPFGSSTPSSKIPVKPNSAPDPQDKRGGAQPGHVGHGRRSWDRREADRVRVIEVGDTCPCCGGRLQDKRVRSRTVVDGHLVRRETVVYDLKRRWCPRCRKSFQARAPGSCPRVCTAITFSPMWRCSITSMVSPWGGWSGIAYETTSTSSRSSPCTTRGKPS